MYTLCVIYITQHVPIRAKRYSFKNTIIMPSNYHIKIIATVTRIKFFFSFKNKY